MSLPCPQGLGGGWTDVATTQSLLALEVFRQGRRDGSGRGTEAGFPASPKFLVGGCAVPSAQASDRLGWWFLSTTSFGDFASFYWDGDTAGWPSLLLETSLRLFLV